MFIIKGFVLSILLVVGLVFGAASFGLIFGGSGHIPGPFEELAKTKNYQWGYQAPKGALATSELGGTGLLDDDYIVGSGNFVSIEPSGIIYGFTTGPNLNEVAGTWSNIVGLESNFYNHTAPLLVSQVEPRTLTFSRYFFGLSAEDVALTLDSDVPPVGHIGVQFNTESGETNWQFVSSDGTSQSRIDSGVPFENRIIKYVEVDLGSTSGTVRLYDNEFVLEAEHTFTSNLPWYPPVAGLRAVHGTKRLAQGGGSSGFYYYQSWYFNRGPVLGE